MNRRYAEKESYIEVPETCPAVEAALGKAEEAIKEQTGRLREALTNALARALEAEEKVEDLEKEVKRLKSELEEATK